MLIQPQLRAQINALAMARAELTAIEEINGYLKARYKTDAEFTDTALYNIATTYKAYDRVYLKYPSYDSTNSYVIGNYCTNGDYAYVCISDTTGNFNPSHWSKIGNTYVLYYAAYPADVFNIYGHYIVGDKVFWVDRVYTCKIATSTINNFMSVQYGTVDNLPLNNVFPTDPKNGAKYWEAEPKYSIAPNTLNSPIYDNSATYVVGDKVTYTDNNVYICITAVTVPEDFDPAKWQLYWAIGDNRSQLMVTHVCNIALYWAHYSIAANVVPDDRRDAYGIAKEWCRSVRDGNNSTPLPVIQPNIGKRILMDSYVKRDNG